MTFSIVSYDNLEISIIGALLSVAIVGVLVLLKQPDLKPIPVRVRRQNDRTHRRNDR